MTTAAENVEARGLHRVSVWRWADRPVAEVHLYEDCTPVQRRPRRRAVTVLFHAPGSIEGITDPNDLLATARLLETVAGWVGNAASAQRARHHLPVPCPERHPEYDETT